MDSGQVGFRRIEIGQLFAARYRVERFLGRGGMGEVFLARDTMLGDEHVALKVLHSELSADGTILERFLREVRLTRQVNHPNVVRTFDFGREGELPYFTMTYLEGSPLSKVGLPLQVESAVPVLHAIALGLEAIHNAGIVHRDLKPSNVIRTSKGEILIADFGVSTGGQSGLTRSSDVIGSAPYLAPEVWNGTPASASSDIYAFGILAFELLSGSLPFTGDTPVQMMARHLSAEPPELTALNPGVPKWLQKFVAACLRKNPAERPQSAAELIRSLEARKAFTSNPVRKTAKNRTVSATAVQSRPKGRAVTIAGSILALLLVAGIVHRGMRHYRKNFTPLPGMIAWFDAADLKLAENAPVALWPARISTIGPAAQPDPEKQPHYRRAPLATVVFDGKMNYLLDDAVAARLRSADSFSVMYAARTLDPALRQEQSVWSMHEADLETNVGRTGFAGGRLLLRGAKRIQNQTPTSGRTSVEDLAIYTALFDSNKVQLRRNGRLMITSPLESEFNLNRAATFSLGRELDHGASEHFLSGEIAEFAVFDHELTPDEYSKYEKSWAGRYKITLEG